MLHVAIWQSAARALQLCNFSHFSFQFHSTFQLILSDILLPLLSVIASFMQFLFYQLSLKHLEMERESEQLCGLLMTIKLTVRIRESHQDAKDQTHC